MPFVPTLDGQSSVFLVWSDQTHELHMVGGEEGPVCSLENISAYVKGTHECDGSKEPQ